MISAINAQQSLNFKTAPKTKDAGRITRQIIRMEQSAPQGLSSNPIHLDLEKELDKSPLLQGILGGSWFSTVAATFLAFTSMRFGS